MNAEILLTYVLLPGALAGLVLLVAWLPWRGMPIEQRETAAERWITSAAGSLAVAGAFIATFTMAAGQVTYPPAEIWHRIALIVVAGGVIGAVSAVWSPSRFGYLLTAGLVGIASGLLFRPLPGVSQPAVWMVGVGAAVFVVAAALAVPSGSNRSVLMPVALWAALTAAAIVLIQSNQLKLTLLAASLAVAAGAMVVVRLLVKRATIERGAFAAFVPALVVLLVLGRLYTYRELPLTSFVLPVGGPALLWVSALPPLQRRPKLAVAAGATIAFVFPVLAVLLTMTAPEETTSTYEY